MSMKKGILLFITFEIVSAILGVIAQRYTPDADGLICFFVGNVFALCLLLIVGGAYGVVMGIAQFIENDKKYIEQQMKIIQDDHDEIRTHYLECCGVEPKKDATLKEMAKLCRKYRYSIKTLNDINK